MRWLWQTTGETGKPFQQKEAQAKQGQSSPLSGCHGNLLDTGRVKSGGMHFFFSSYWPFLHDYMRIRHICICLFLYIMYIHTWPMTWAEIAYRNTCTYLNSFMQNYRFLDRAWHSVSAFRDMHVNKACMSQTSCFCITNAAISAGALAEHSRTNIAQAARWWPNWCIHAIGHALAQYSRTLSGC